MKHYSKIAGRRGGCLFVIFTAFVACALVLINGLLLAGFYAPIETLATQTLGDEKFGQGFARAVLYLGPIFMLIVQWWLLDLLADLFSNDQRLDGSGSGRDR